MRLSAKFICKSAIFAALYVILTWCIPTVAYGPLQVRPAEALCILPMLFLEAVPGLFVGCMIANTVSWFGIFDIILGSLTTLFAALLTYLFSKIIKNAPLKLIVCGLFPVLLNSFVIPAVWLLASVGNVVYFTEVAIMLLNESVWIYGAGIPLYFALKKISNKI